MTTKPDVDDGLSVWQQRCQAQGLSLTAPRNAILSALLEQTEARDAVPLLQAAQAHYPGTSIGTVYRFLRELEQRGLVDAHALPHSRTRWQLRATALSTAAQAASDIRRMVAQAQEYLRTLEQMGLASATLPNAPSSLPQSESARALAALHEIAGQLGYRLLPNRTPIA
jgi:DNA-binding MarR family transcriptional regulator